MALNFSQRPIFPLHLPEDNFVSPIGIANGYLIEDIPEKTGDGFSKPWHLNSGVGDMFDCERERFDMGGSRETASGDIIDLLPSDPFGMDIRTTFTAITGWLEDFEANYGGYQNNGDYQLFAGLNFIWNNAMKFQTFNEDGEIEHQNHVYCGSGVCSEEMNAGDISCNIDFGSDSDVNDSISWGNESIEHETEQCSVSCVGSCFDGDAGSPHSAWMFALGYLDVQDLLSAGRVCRSLHCMIKNDPLLWLSIHIDQPLNEKITDDALLQLTNRAQGNLQCLSLVDCPRITDNGLKHVLESNPSLNKLSVPGCTRLSIEGIVDSLKALKDVGKLGVKNLRIGGLYGVMQKHYDELKSLLGTNSDKQQNTRKPHFYNRGNIYLSCDDEQAIDVEMCPICQNLRLVYDCPSDCCQGKENVSQPCRACALCILRCVQCGCCINDSEYEETFCLELLCLDCLIQLRKCQEG